MAGGQPRITGVKGKGIEGAAARAGVAAYLAEVDERAQDFRPAWGGVIAEFHREEMKVFEREGAVGGHGPWQELSPRYKLWKDKQRPGVPILFLTGRLADALINAGTHGCLYHWGRWHLLIQTDVPVDGYDLGGLHMLGRGSPNPMPVREPIRLTMDEVWRMVGCRTGGGPILDWLLEGKGSTRAAYLA